MTTFLSEVFKEKSAFRLPHIPLNAPTHPHQAWAVIKSKLLKHPHHRLRQILLSVGYGLNVFRQSRPRRLLFCFHFSALLHFLPLALALPDLYLLGENQSGAPSSSWRGTTESAGQLLSSGFFKTHAEEMCWVQTDAHVKGHPSLVDFRSMSCKAWLLR